MFDSGLSPEGHDLLTYTFRPDNICRGDRICFDTGIVYFDIQYASCQQLELFTLLQVQPGRVVH